MNKKTIEVELPFTIGDEVYVQIEQKYLTEDIPCPACGGKKVLYGMNDKGYTCPLCRGAGKIRKGTPWGWKVAHAKVIGICLRDFQIGKDTANCHYRNNDNYYDVEILDQRMKACERAFHQKYVFATREEAEAL